MQEYVVNEKRVMVYLEQERDRLLSPRSITHLLSPRSLQNSPRTLSKLMPHGNGKDSSKEMPDSFRNQGFPFGASVLKGFDMRQHDVFGEEHGAGRNGHSIINIPKPREGFPGWLASLAWGPN